MCGAQRPVLWSMDHACIPVDGWCQTLLRPGEWQLSPGEVLVEGALERQVQQVQQPMAARAARPTRQSQHELLVRLETAIVRS